MMRRCISVLVVAVLIPVSAAAGAVEPLPGVIAGYDPERGTFVRTADGRWEFNPYAMIQVTHTVAGQGSRIETTGFNLHAAKLILHGHVYDPSLSYHFQLNAGEGRVVAEDVYLQWRAKPWLALLAGQTEVPFNRQHITLEAYQELVDRSTVDARFSLQRDIGAAVYVSDPEMHHEATVGLWNGARQNAPNDDTGYLGTLRLAYNPFGPIAYREADLDESPTPKVSLAVGGAYNPERHVAAVAPATSMTTLHHVAQGVAEVTLRYRGLSLTNEAHVRRQAVDGAPHAWDSGAFVQVGYFVVPHHLQLVSRVARIEGVVGTMEPMGEETVGSGYYFLGHRFKIQADASHFETRSASDAWRARMQLEFFL